jgi:hypothetical protein
VQSRSSAAKVGGAIRDLWIAIGICLLLFALLEGAYVGQRSVRAALFGSDAVRAAQEEGHPYAGEEWYKDFLVAQESARERYDPWRGYWAYPVTSRYLNVDSAGRRVTVQPVGGPTRRRQVFMLGGSAMWGFTSRDSLTLPSLVASGLRDAGLADVSVVNLAQPGYTIGHEVATLIQELNRGRVPAIVVLYDGINDIRTAHLYREPGHAFFEARFRHLYEVEAQRGFFAAFAAPATRSRLIQRLLVALGAPGEWTVPPRTASVCPDLGGYYRNVRRHVEGLGQAWGFSAVFIQQPNHGSTRKPLTPFEKSFLGPDWQVEYTRECSAAIDSAMMGDSSAYRSFGGFFDDRRETVFLDRFGHVTEAANRVIADSLVAELVPRLRAGAIADSTPARNQR